MAHSTAWAGRGVHIFNPPRNFPMIAPPGSSGEYRFMIPVDPLMNLQALCNRAFVFHQQGNLVEAERLYSQILAFDPANFVVCHLLGIVRHRQGRNVEALELIGAALTINPKFVEAQSNYGNVLNALGRFAEALASFDKALTIKPDFIEALNNRGGALQGLNRFEEALAS